MNRHETAIGFAISPIASMSAMIAIDSAKTIIICFRFRTKSSDSIIR